MNNKPDQPMDRVAREVVRAGGLDEHDLDRVSSNPFFNARVRARIDIERKRRAGRGSGRLRTLVIAARAIAMLALVTIAAAAMSWISRPTPGVRPGPPDDIGRVAAGGTCALSSTEECAISNDEVLATLFADEGGDNK